ncbi:hypothetical protein [Streptomyces sp. HUAS TT20]|uniref:hypothetical protein n=1 Tax=Streptomyces sp. HUAS TT20 TaxID=3447509 RepID=UPI0021DA35B4|nr:hypothetical protein [Streptomyces sp. HUAS 15-9]UXY28414.1 hypothetical protein N8I87_18745 [Streptomyces sp. HUAS 15-9]
MPSAPRRRGRTALLLASAGVLGLVAGACTGYLIQADRKPTALPSLSQPVLAQAKGEGPEPLSAAQDHKVKTDGDLRKLLIAPPKGAKKPPFGPGEDGWLNMAEYASQLKNSDTEFVSLATSEFRRAVSTTWAEHGNQFMDIRLVQFHQEEDLGAQDRANGWNVDGTHSWSIPGTGDGMVYVDTEPERKPGYMPLYKAQAHAWRGDIAMEIWIYDTKPISKSRIMDLAKRQMERL